MAHRAHIWQKNIFFLELRRVSSYIEVQKNDLSADIYPLAIINLKQKTKKKNNFKLL